MATLCTPNLNKKIANNYVYNLIMMISMEKEPGEPLLKITS